MDKNLYEVQVFGDSENVFKMELSDEEVIVINSFLEKLNDKVKTGELAWYDYPSISFKSVKKE
jgi:hypothetical protein